MSYSAFEVDQGGVLERVEAFCRHLTQGGSFTDSTPVSLSDVEMFIDDAYFWLVGELSKNGYGTAVTDTNVKKVLQQIQALDVVGQIEFSQPVTESGEPNDRFKSMAARRDRLVKDYIWTDTLERMGLARSKNKSTDLELTGRSISRKDTVYGDTDIVGARFPRGFGQRRDVGRRSGAQTGGGLADPNL